MEIIQKLSDMIEEEMEDAEKYIRCAIENKEERPMLADVFYRLSDEEMKHMSILHEQVTTIIADWRNKNGDIPDGMKMLYDILHKKHIAKATAIRAMQAMYKSPAAV